MSHRLDIDHPLVNIADTMDLALFESSHINDNEFLSLGCHSPFEDYISALSSQNHLFAIINPAHRKDTECMRSNRPA